MADSGGGKWRSPRLPLIAAVNFLLALAVVSAERGLNMPEMSPSDGTRRSSADDRRDFINLIAAANSFLRRADGADYRLVWPEMEFGWRIVAGTAVGFMGGAFGSVGGLGGGAFFLPMLNLIIGFDPKSSTAISKCMIMGAAISTVYYNLKLRHPALDMPIIDYDLVLLIQPMLMLGISIGVIFNVILADWMVTILLLILFLFISTKAFLKGVAAWKKETLLLKREADKFLGESPGSGSGEGEYRALPGGPEKETKQRETEVETSILQNVCWKELGLLFFVWFAFLVLQILKEKTVSCSWKYWLLNLLQIPVSVGVCSYEAINLYKGRRVISSLGDRRTEFRVGQLLAYGSLGVTAGTVAGLLGVGGGSIMGPLFLELGVPPQVASASATFAMMFSSSMSVVEYYLLDQFPVPYAVYFAMVAMVAAYCGQHVVRKIIALLGRASIIIFVLSFTLLFFSFTQGGVGISDAIQRIQRNEYMGFQNLCRSSG